MHRFKKVPILLLWPPRIYFLVQALMESSAKFGPLEVFDFLGQHALEIGNLVLGILHIIVVEGVVSVHFQGNIIIERPESLQDHLLFQVPDLVEHSVLQEFEGAHPEVRVKTEHILEDVHDRPIWLRQLVTHPVVCVAQGRLLLLKRCIGGVGVLEALHIVDCVMTRYEGEVAIILTPQLLQKHLQLVDSTHSSHFLISFRVMVQPFARSQWKTRVALKWVPDFRESVVIKGFAVLERVLDQLEQDAA